MVLCAIKPKHVKSNAKDNYFHYVRPQESGSHYHTSYLSIDNLCDIIANNPFSFSINPYTTNELINCKHDFELPKSNKVVLNIDLAHRGIGSHSCGPILDDKFALPREGHNIIEINF